MTTTYFIRRFKDTYVDSVIQMSGTRVLEESPGVIWGSTAMATPANIDTLIERGFATHDLDGAKPGDLFIAVEASDEAAAAEAAERAEASMFSGQRVVATGAEEVPISLDQALRLKPAANIAIISVPGDYAALEAHKCLGRELDVLLFSDNVSRADEIALKEHAAARGRLLMGPGAGTAMLAGTGLAFANVVSPGPVGVIAAAGTGAQEAMSLLDRWGVGVSQVIGLGGRDLNDDIGGRMAALAIDALKSDPATEVILFVSKPPAPHVAEYVLSLADGFPMVAAFMGVDLGMAHPAGVLLANTLEGGVLRTMELLGLVAPDTTVIHGPSIEEAIDRLPAERTLIRGLYSGGTLCYEALVLLGQTYPLPVYSNTPIDKKLSLPAPDGSSVLLDLGEEEFTNGRPHPMIDPMARIEQIEQAATDPRVAVILLDVVLGHGAHRDPAGVLVPKIQDLMQEGGPQVVAYVLGTNKDPQNFDAQVEKLVEAGCLVTETNARAALAAGAIASRDQTRRSLSL
jgi:FdrA protein